MKTTLFATAFLALTFTALARPWTPDQQSNSTTIDILSQQQNSPFTTTIDSVTLGFSRSLKTFSPTMIPIVSMATLTYIGYVASVMFFPTAVTRAGLPLLDDFDMRTFRSLKDSQQGGFVDSLATGFVKDILGKTEAADVLRNATTMAAKRSMDTLKSSTRMLNLGLGSLRNTVDNAITIMSPGCMSRYMCRVGQFTSIHLPILGTMLRSINNPELDEYTHALIDGTTIGDCNAVFHECSL